MIEFQEELTGYLSDITSAFYNQGGVTQTAVKEHIVDLNKLTTKQKVVSGDRPTRLAAAP